MFFNLLLLLLLFSLIISRQFILMFVEAFPTFIPGFATRRSLRNKCLNISGDVACLMYRFHLVITYDDDITTILVSLTETIFWYLYGNELIPVLGSSQTAVTG